MPPFRDRSTLIEAGLVLRAHPSWYFVLTHLGTPCSPILVLHAHPSWCSVLTHNWAYQRRRALHALYRFRESTYYSYELLFLRLTNSGILKNYDFNYFSYELQIAGTLYEFSRRIAFSFSALGLCTTLLQCHALSVPCSPPRCMWLAMWSKIHVTCDENIDIYHLQRFNSPCTF